MLIMLQELMQRVEHEAKLGRTPLPWEYFDLIGGSGMGGVFALLFSVWRLSVDEMIAVYLTLHNEVFTNEGWLNRDIQASSQLFDHTFRKIAVSLGRNADETLVRDTAYACKAFVCTLNPVNMNLPRLFRTYRARSNRSPDCSVAKAILASVAGHPHITQVTVGQPPEQFISAAHRISNPSFEVLREARDVFGLPHDVHVACIVSLGAGQQEPLASDSSEPELFRRIERDTEAVDQELERRFGDVKDLFCRLNVMHGLERNAQASESLSTITTHTKHYLALEVVGKKLDALVENLRKRPAKVTLARMNSVVGPDAHDFTVSIKLHNSLSYIPYVNGASYNSEAGCMEGTRVDLLSSIHSWIESGSSSSAAEVLLLSAVAGAGKSAVAHTVAKIADERGFLASSFFFQRGVQGRDSVQAMLSTVIRDLAGRNQRFGDAVGEAVNKDRSLASANPQRQFDKLLLPYARCLLSNRPCLIVIDALDEISVEVELRVLLNFLRSRTRELPSNLRIFVTSRLIDIIGRALTPTAPNIRTETINTQNAINKDDLSFFVGTSLREIAEEHFLDDWPNPEITEKLASKAEGLFIWASVVVNLLRSEAFSAVDALAEILDNSRSGLNPEAKMDEMYAKALAVCGKWSDKCFRPSYEAVVGALVTARAPLSLSAMQALYRHDARLNATFPSILKALRPLLISFQEEHRDHPIQVIHLSFKDFVIGKSHSGRLSDQYRISISDQNEEMTLRCLQVLNDDLSEATPGVGSFDLEEEGIPQYDFSRVSLALLYASQHWKSHLAEINHDLPDQIFQALAEFTSANRLCQWIEFVTCSRGFQKVTDLMCLIQLRAPHHNVILESLESVKCARILSCLEQRLKDMNRLEEALSAMEDVVQIWKMLEDSRHGELNPELANSLIVLSNLLANLGRREEALKAIEEAVGILRSLATARPEAINPNLALSLNNFSSCLRALGRREKALKAIEEAIEIRRSLAAARPEAFNPDLAVSLKNFSICLGDLGRREEALKAIEEAIEILRSLATARPEAFNPDLALSLKNFSSCLRALGRREEALSFIEEAVGIHRSLAAARPEAFNPDLAMSLKNFSICLGDLGRREEALKAIEEAIEILREEALSFIEEAVGIHRSLATARPEAFNPDLAMSLTNFSIRLGDLGRREEALKAIEEAVELRRSLATERPDAFNPDLAQSLTNFSIRLGDLGRREEALKAIEEAVELYRPLSLSLPTAFGEDFTGALEQCSECLRNLGREDEADVVYQESIDVKEALYQS